MLWTILSYAGYAVAAAIVGYVAWFGFVDTGLPRKLKDVKGKHVLITGGSAGLGKSIAVKFAQMGAHVTILARNQSKLDDTMKAMEKVKVASSQLFLSISCDVTKWSEVDKAVKKAVAELGVPDYLIANAGQSFPGYFAEIPVETMEKEMAINYFGVLYLIKAALPSIIERNKGGHLVIVSSAAALTPFVGYTNYAATKSAARALGDGLKNELLLYNMDVSVYLPTNIDTEGLATENLTKPIETKDIEGSNSKTFSPDICAQILIDGLSKGQYYITNEFLTELARAIGHGVGPRNSFFFDLFLSPLGTFLAPLFRSSFDSTVLSSKKRQKKNN